MKVAIMLISLFGATSIFACCVPKEHVVCHRKCYYNYYGPGVHCDEACFKQKFKQSK